MIHANKAKERTREQLFKLDKDVPYYAEEALQSINNIIANETLQYYTRLKKDLNLYTTKRIPEPIRNKVLNQVMRTLEDNFDYLVYDDLEDPENYFIVKWE